MLEALEPEEFRQFEEHLAQCVWCNRKVEELRRINDTLLHVPEEKTPPSDVWVRLLEQIPGSTTEKGKRGWVVYAAVTLILFLAGASLLYWLYLERNVQASADLLQGRPEVAREMGATAKWLERTLSTSHVEDQGGHGLPL